MITTYIENIYKFRSKLREWYNINDILNSEDFDDQVISQIRSKSLIKEISIDSDSQIITVILDPNDDNYEENVSQTEIISYISMVLSNFINNNYDKITSTFTDEEKDQFTSFSKSNLIFDSSVIGIVIKISL